MKHEQKVKLARKMQTASERKYNRPIFSCFNWSMRRAAREKRPTLYQQREMISSFLNRPK
jgi:hypothetical protein